MADVSGPDEGAASSVWLLLGGLSVVGVAFVWNQATPTSMAALRFAVLAVGLVAVGAALAVRLPQLGNDTDSRLAGGGLWLLAAVGAFVARHAVAPDWSSLPLLFNLLCGVAVLAALLTAVPRDWRLFLGSLLILAHFAAICTAITVVPPPNGPPPFVPLQLYVRFFHPYLVATNMNNGYHFYAPEPGPSALLWFRVQWADGASRWERAPDHPKMANHLQRRRLGALATVITQTQPLPPHRAEALIKARTEAGERQDIPLSPDQPPAVQYREPTPVSKHLLSSFARFIARHTPHPDGATVAITGIKIYSVEYFNPPVEHFLAGREPVDPSLYVPHYMGDYEPDGRLKESCYRLVWAPGTTEPEVVQDPFLYWRVPVIRKQPPVPERKPGEHRRAGVPTRWSSEGKVTNYVWRHAGDRDRDEETVP